MPLHPNERVTAAPGISPGPVENEEVLLREMYSPQHVQNGKVVSKRVFTLDDLAQGLSVHRMKYTPSAFIKAAIRERLLAKEKKGKPWTSEGVAVFTAEEVRKILWQNEQAFIVKDTALLEHPGHASIHAIIDVADPKKRDVYLRELRSDLTNIHRLFDKRMLVDEVFQQFVGTAST